MDYVEKLYEYINQPAMLDREPYIFIFNGPPGSGKDTIAHGIYNAMHGVVHVKFATPIKRIVSEMLGMHQTVIEERKDQYIGEPNTMYGFATGWTYRQLLIYISEVVMKPLLGSRVFGHLLVETINTQLDEGKRLFVVSDGGFEEEVVPLHSEFRNVHIIPIQRKGCGFAGDSRNYLVTAEDGIYNNGTKEELFENAARIMLNILTRTRENDA